jgi:polyisoprenyl-phosphate glycosyltransferase
VAARPACLALLVPVFDESEQTLSALCHRLNAWALSKRFAGTLVLMLVDDGSTRPIAPLIESRLPSLRGFQQVQVLRLDAHRGQHAALACGLENCDCDTVVVLDSDLQYGPENIERLVAPLEGGALLVSGYRIGRDDPLWQRLGSWLSSRLAGLIVGYHLRDFTCPVTALRREIIGPTLTLQGERRRFLKPVLVQLAQGRIAEVPVVAALRARRASRYTFRARLHLFFDFLAHYAQGLYQLLALGGLLALLASGLGAAAYLLDHLLAASPHLGVRTQALVVLAAVLGGLTLVLGVLGDLTVRIYNRLPAGELYRLAEREVWQPMQGTHDRAAVGDDVGARAGFAAMGH